MKKATGIILCAVIIIVSAVSLMSCGGSKAGGPVTNRPDSEKIVGKWDWTYDMTDLLKQQFANTPNISFDTSTLKDLTIKMIFDFAQDGTYKFSLDEAYFDEFFTKMKSTIKPSLVNMLNDQLKAYGMSLDEYLQAAGISSVDTLIDQTFNDEMKAGMKSGFSEMTGKYKIDNGKLFMADKDKDFVDNSYMKYEFINDNELKFTEVEGMDTTSESAKFAYEQMMPMTLIRK